jgi:Domain of unknown function (DUF4129)
MRVTVLRSVRKAVAAMAAAATLWLVIAASGAVAAAAPPGLSGVDPAIAARDVFRDQDFWWKRIESKTVPTSWLESILKALLELLGRILRAILDAIARIRRSLFGIFTGGAAGGGAIVWVIIAVVLAWSIWRLYPVIVRWLTSGSTAPNPDGVTWQTLPESSDLYEEAARALRDAKYAEAIRLALLALIARLERRGLLRYDTSRTNREYQMELRHATELAALFGRLARIYDRVWYGRVSAGRAEAEEAIHLCGSAINTEDLAPE